MPRQNLTREKILESSLELIRRDGYGSFSLQELSRELNIKPPSVYYHFPEGLEEIKTEISLRVCCRLRLRLEEAAAGLRRGEALIAVGEAYYDFVLKAPECYDIILALPQLKSEELSSAVWELVGVFTDILGEYDIGREESVHLSRMYRSLIHGHLALAKNGYMSHLGCTDAESYRAMLEYFARLVSSMEAKSK